LAEANKLSASIGELMKSGKREEAEAMKSQTASLKERSKELAESLDIFSNDLQQKLYLLPNTPAEIVPEGKTADDNINVFQEGEIPVLHEGAQPHWV
jgi:seryl-tRNA synthetase